MGKYILLSGYVGLPSEEHHVSVEEIRDEFFGMSTKQKVDKVVPRTKQFLAFSDNRQTAAFFSSYLGMTYRYALNKRIICQTVFDNAEQFENGMPMKQFVKNLSVDMEKYGLVEDGEDPISEAWISVLSEISNYKAKSSTVNIGVVSFEPDFDDVPALERLGLSKEETIDLFRVMCRSMMKEAAIDCGITFQKADVERFAISGHLKGYENHSAGYMLIIGWTPEQNKTNKRKKYLTKVLNAAGADENVVDRLLDSMWAYLKGNDYLVQRSFGKKTGYLLDVNKFSARRVRKLYKCTECKQITPYSIRGVCDSSACNGHLEEYDYINDLKDNMEMIMNSKMDYSDLAIIKTAKQKQEERNRELIAEDIRKIDEALESTDEDLVRTVHKRIDGKYQACISMWAMGLYAYDLQHGAIYDSLDIESKCTHFVRDIVLLMRKGCTDITALYSNSYKEKRGLICHFKLLEMI